MNRSPKAKNLRKFSLLHSLVTFLLLTTTLLGWNFFDHASFTAVPGMITVLVLLTPIYFIGTLPVFFINMQLTRLLLNIGTSRAMQYILINVVCLLTGAALGLFYFFFSDGLPAWVFLQCVGIYLCAMFVSGLLWNWLIVYKRGGKPVVKGVN